MLTEQTAAAYHDKNDGYASWEIFKYLPTYGGEFVENRLLKISGQEAHNDPFEFIPPRDDEQNRRIIATKVALIIDELVDT